ncbi:hypothetical protein BKA80DRAFT_65368 [Phyllosticta citrichinensis]
MPVLQGARAPRPRPRPRPRPDTITTSTTRPPQACLSSNNRSLESLASLLLSVTDRHHIDPTSNRLPASRHHTGTQSHASHRITLPETRKSAPLHPPPLLSTGARALPRTPDGCSSKRSPPPQGCTSGSVTGGAVGLTIDMLYLLYLSIQRINMARGIGAHFASGARTRSQDRLDMVLSRQLRNPRKPLGTSVRGTRIAVLYISSAPQYQI